MNTNVLADINDERNRQDRIWGVQEHAPCEWVAILTEELGEVAACALGMFRRGYRTELVQLAAIVVAAIESFDRKCLALGVAAPSAEGGGESTAPEHRDLKEAT